MLFTYIYLYINICVQKIELPEYTDKEYNEHLRTINDGVGDLYKTFINLNIYIYFNIYTYKKS